MSELPSHWSFVTLRELGGLVGGKTPTKATDAYWRNGSIPWTSPKDMKRFILSDSEDHISTHAVEDGGMQVLPENTILMVTRSGILDHTFPVAIATMQTAINQDIKALAPSQEIDTKYLAYALRHAGPEILRTCAKAGTTVPSVQIAPLNEQKRIADKLEMLLTQVTSSLEKLERTSELVKQFRQAVLAAATAGVLTEDWRKQNGISSEWQHVKLSEIAEIQNGVTKNSKKQVSTDKELPYLRVANVQRGYFDLAEIKNIRVPTDKLDSLLLESGDILFNEGGDIDKLGRGWVWENQIERSTFQNHVFRARLYDSSNQPKYISWWGNYRGLNYFLRAGKQTTNLASINKSVLSNLPVSLPSSVEQLEIVSRVETLFDLADDLETRISTARNQLEKLTPALLTKAFRGELVSQDPTDEPASVLLEQIRAVRKLQPVTKPERKPRTPRTKPLRAGGEPVKRLEDVPSDHLTQTIKERDPDQNALEAKTLWQASDLSIDDFYQQLSREVSGGLLRVNGDQPAIIKAA